MTVPRAGAAGRPMERVIAHRGFSLDGLENTLTAFAAARDLGCSWVESDVHATSDDVAVLHHDAALDRTTDATGALASLEGRRLADVRVAGRERIPTLAEFFERFDDLHLNLDLKVSEAIAPTVAVIERLRVHDRVRIASFDDRRSAAARALLSRAVRSSPGRSTLAKVLAVHRLPGAGRTVRRLLAPFDAVQVPTEVSTRIRGHARTAQIVTPRFVDAVHAAGRELHVWTINDPDRMRELLDLGVDALITDRADLARKVLGA